MSQRILIVSTNETDFEWPDDYVTKTAADRPTGLRLVREWRPDVAILVANAQCAQEVDTIRKLRDGSPENSLPVLLIADRPEPEPLIAAIRAGARGFLSGDAPPDIVRVAVRALLAGGGYFGAEATDRLVEHCVSHITRPMVLEPDEPRRRRLLEDAAMLRRMADALSDRVARYSDLAAPAAVPVLAPPAASGGARIIACVALDTADGLPELVRDRLAGLDIGTVIGHAGDVVLVTAPDRDWRKIASALVGLDRPVYVGISTAFTDDPAAAVEDALAALAALRRCDAPADSELSVEEFTLPMWLAEAADHIALGRRLPASFHRLRNYPTLSKTLTRWLRYDCDVRRAATTMHVHPNTVRYRLSKVEQIIRHSLSDLPVLTSLYLITLASPAPVVSPAEPAAAPPGRARR
ncbi:helix-turn-helix domain-containing protein [Amycolatopsis pigmentata]|uniref:Helix-turn-helix domain-containing protein n=1 Tax=Amycolatopsis pigmentata TaxID=450801 RepID=A0ABW5FKK7_9PSEU